MMKFLFVFKRNQASKKWLQITLAKSQECVIAIKQCVKGLKYLDCKIACLEYVYVENINKKTKLALTKSTNIAICSCERS